MSREHNIRSPGGGGTLCPITGKHGYLDRRAATAAKRRVKQMTSRKMRVYKCDWCPSWHLTNQARSRRS
jgi:hypothetical protein